MAKKLRIIISLILVAVFSLCGCSALYEYEDISDIPALNKTFYETDGLPRLISRMIYYIDKDTGLLKGDMHDVVVYPDQDEEDILVEMLLERCRNEEHVTAMNAELIEVELLDDMANVYLSGGGSDREKYLLASQIADTLIDSVGIEFACVFFDGKAIDISGYAVGALTKSNGDPASAFEELEDKYSRSAEENIEINIYAPLYFLDGSKEFFLPEIRKIRMEGTFKDAQSFNSTLIKSLISGLADGPDMKYYLSTYVLGSYMDDRTYSVDYADGNVTVDWRTGIFTARCDAEKHAFYYTVAGAVPMDGEIVINLPYDDSIVLTRDVCKATAGDQLKVYIPDTEAGTLSSETRIVSDERSRDIVTYAEELMLALGEKGILKEADPDEYVLGIRMDGDIAIIDLSESFFEAASTLDDEAQRLLAFAIVNTLETSGKASRTAIRKEGEIPQGFGGNIDLEYPLMPDYGLYQ